MYKIYRRNNYLIIDDGIDISEKYLAKDILVQEIVEDVSYEIFGILPKLGNSNNQLLHSISIPNIIKEDDSPYTTNEWVDFYTVNTGFFFELTNGGGDSGSIPENQFVDSYSDLPDPTTTQYKIWIAKNAEGSQWLPGSLGGTYYPEGGYVSDGVKWIYHKDNYQATQPEVNSGIVTTKWVSPFTFENASKWSTKYDTSNPSGFETPTQLNSRDTNNRTRLNHTGTQLSSTISDIQTTITNNTSVLANTAKITNATHTGDVTGSTTLTITANIVTNAKLAQMGANTFKANNTGSAANALDITPTQAKTLLAITNTDVSGLGSLATQSGTFSGTSSGTNTGDNAINTTYANDYRAANFIAGTNYLAPNGSAAALTSFPTFNQNTTGTASTITGNISESQVTNLITDLSAKQNNISLTTIGTSGPATFIGTTLNIPNYATGGGGGSGNSTTQTVDFGSTFTDKAQIIVTGQSWVTTTSEIITQIKTPTSTDPDEMRLFEFEIVISDLIDGVGFTITVYSEPEATGTYDIMCIGI